MKVRRRGEGGREGERGRREREDMRTRRKKRQEDENEGRAGMEKAEGRRQEVGGKSQGRRQEGGAEDQEEQFHSSRRGTKTRPWLCFSARSRSPHRMFPLSSTSVQLTSGQEDGR
eukprot:752611-Hanusia_phi.AAC.2